MLKNVSPEYQTQLDTLAESLLRSVGGVAMQELVQAEQDFDRVFIQDGGWDESGNFIQQRFEEIL